MMIPHFQKQSILESFILIWVLCLIDELHSGSGIVMGSFLILENLGKVLIIFAFGVFLMPLIELT